MQLEEYFEFLTPNDIRIKGHRIGIEHVLYEHIYQCRTPDEIQRSFPTLALEEVSAAILYYERNRETMRRYVDEWLEWGEEQRRKQAADPSLDSLRQRMARVREAALVAPK